MDPDRTWELIGEAFQRRDYRSAQEHVTDLRGWMTNGGAIPKALESFGRTKALTTIAILGEYFHERMQMLRIPAGH